MPTCLKHHHSVLVLTRGRINKSLDSLGLVPLQDYRSGEGLQVRAGGLLNAERAVRHYRCVTGRFVQRASDAARRVNESHKSEERVGPPPSLLSDPLRPLCSQGPEVAHVEPRYGCSGTRLARLRAGVRGSVRRKVVRCRRHGPIGLAEGALSRAAFHHQPGPDRGRWVPGPPRAGLHVNPL